MTVPGEMFLGVLAGPERLVSGDDGGGQQLRDMYWSYARPLRESADAIAKDC